MSLLHDVELACFLQVFWVFVFMWWHGKFPSIDSVQQLATVINSRGGNILWLGSFSLIFFFTAIKFTYWVLNHIVDGKIDATNAIVLAGFTFITGSAFGGAFTSMVKAMTGEVPAPPAPPGGGNAVTRVTTETVTQSPPVNGGEIPKGNV